MKTPLSRKVSLLEGTLRKSRMVWWHRQPCRPERLICSQVADREVTRLECGLLQRKAAGPESKEGL